MASRGWLGALALIGGTVLCLALAGTAAADPTIDFAITGSSPYAPGTITVEDRTANPDGYPLIYEWQRFGRGGDLPLVGAGSPECLDAVCSRVRWVADLPGDYGVRETIRWPGHERSKTDSIGFLSPADAQAEIFLVGPTSRPLPADLELLSPKTHLLVYNCFTGEVTDPAKQPCKPYFVGKTGPDAGGLYRYFWRLPTAAPGLVGFEASAWSVDPVKSDHERITFTAVTAGVAFGEFHTCLMPVIRPRTDGAVALELTYYSRQNSTALVFQRERSGGRWGPLRLRARKEFPPAENESEYGPYLRRAIYLRVRSTDLSGDRVRLFYAVVRGSYRGDPGEKRRLPKLTRYSAGPCVYPGLGEA